MITHFSHPSPSDSLSLVPQPPPRQLIVLICSLASIIIVGGLSALLQIDFPTIQFLRSTHVPFLEEMGRIGNRLGSGWILVLLSVALLIVGYSGKLEPAKQAGLHTLLAHGVAALITQILKHSIGRPRPRFAHQDHWQLGPSFQSGLDAFPSGHSSASFAVAAVLARHFPQGAWIIYGVALFVALSRIIKGSHFPSDACAGALLGYAVGYIASRPLGAWRTSLLEALAKGLPFFVSAIGLLWIMVQKPSLEILYQVIVGIGIVVVAVGYGIRLRTFFANQNHLIDKQTRLVTSSLLIALGLACCTGSFLITVLGSLAGISWWVVQSHQVHTATVGPHHDEWRGSFKTIANEVLFGIGIILSLGLIYQLRGAIPLI